MRPEPRVALEGLELGYGGAPALLCARSLAAEAGEFVCLLGRNGSGKSTLLRTMAGLQLPREGRVLLEGDHVARLSPAERARRIAVVLTERAGAPGLRVEDLVELGRHPHTSWLGRLGGEDREIASQALSDVGGDTLRGRSVDSLSDGERQRVMIARALAQEPRVLLLDEITAFLDLPSRVAIMSLLRGVARSRRTVVVLSSHDLELSTQLADRLWLLPGDGRLVDGLPEELALSSRLGEVFDSPAVRFSTERGTFELQAVRADAACVSGDPPAVLWTERLLVRRGFRLAGASASAVVVDVRRAGEAWEWRGTCRGRALQCSSLAELARSVA